MTSFEDRLKIIVGDMSGREFAARLGKSPSTVNQYLTGARKPSIEFIVLICERFNIDSWWLMTGEEKASRELAAEPTPVYLPELSPKERRKKKLVNMLNRIIDEGDEKKIKAVEAQLDLLDPGEKRCKKAENG